MTALSVTTRTTTAPEGAYAFVAGLENHWQFDGRYLRLERLPGAGAGGRIRVGTPFGVGRTARTELTRTVEPRLISGTASVGARTRARVSWTIEPHRDGACIALAADLLDVGWFDRLLLSLGGRWWLRRQFQHVLARLVRVLERRGRADASLS